MRPALYIPNFNGAQRIGLTLQGLRRQSREIEVVVVDNGSTDGSPQLIRDGFPEVLLIELEENVGFGPALNQAIATHGDADPVILLNDDAVPEPRFVEALLENLTPSVDSVAGVLLQERDPGLIDSAGVVADKTLMGFDYLHGEALAAAAGAPDPLGPTGGAALYRRTAFDAVGGFDERIFLYYEDLDLALRLAAQGGRCRLASEAHAVHAYSASLGATSASKYAATGWSRGYMLRRYGIAANPRLALRALSAEAALCAGQILRHRTAAGLVGRIRGWRQAAGLPRRDTGAAELQDLRLREALALRRRRAGLAADEPQGAPANLPPQVTDSGEQRTVEGRNGPPEHPPIRFSSRAELAAHHLSGEGLEIGALHSPTPVPAGARTRFVDRKPASELRREYWELAELDLVEIDVVDDGEVLATIEDQSQAYIIANHFLEHCEDPIGTIGTHLRKLQPGGVLLYAVPDKRYTFDFRRPLTPLEHMIADHEEGPARSRRQHYEEWTALTPEPPPEEARDGFESWAREEARKLEAENASIHMHVWTQAEFLQLILHCRSRFDECFDIEAAVRIGPEFVVVLRKQERS